MDDYDVVSRNIMTGSVRVLVSGMAMAAANDYATRAIMRRSSAHEIVFVAPSGAFSKTSTREEGDVDL